jgi:CO dehydrogenase/acetyl-CoA synthase epsilon subunit
MKLELINGQFSGEEIFEIVSKMINVKIKFHEQKISTSDAEEDIKLREKKIKSLQDKLQEIRLFLKDKSQIYLDGQLNFGI